MTPPSPKSEWPIGRGHSGIASVLVRNSKLVAAAARGTLVVVGVIQVVAALLGGLLLWSAGQVIEGLSGDQADWAATWPWIVVLAGVTTISAVLTAAGNEYQRLISELVQRDTSERLIAASAQVPFERFDDDGFYNRMRRAAEGSVGSATAIVWGTLGATRTIIDSVVIVALLLTVVPVVVPIAIVAFIPLFVMSRRSNRVQHRFAWAQTEDDRERGYLGSLFTDRASAREVRMFDLGRWFGATHRKLWQERLVRLRKVIRTRIANAAIGAFVSSATTAGALGLVAWMASRGDLSLADAGVGILGAHRLGGSSTRLNSSLASLHQGALHMRDYDSFLAEANQAAEQDVGDDLPTTVSEISFEDVSFRYAGSEVDALHNVNLVLREGEVAALVGANGSGKSTLMLLLSGLYRPTSGRILWDGVDVATYRPSSLRKAIAPMFQDFTRYQLMTRDNIAVSDLEARADDARVLRAADRASAGPVLDRLVEGLETRLSRAYTDGTELSAGQWQRLAVARALFHNGPVLVLDEPSADLDPIAERELVDELGASCADRVVLVISHRFSAVRRSDRVVVMSEGRIIEDGSHDELLDATGVYAAMYRTQVG